MSGAYIPNGMNSIQPQTVQVKFIQPHQGILQIKIPDAITPGVIEVDGFTPESLVLVGEVWAILTKVISFRAEMVVYNIQNNCDSVSMRFVNQGFESCDTAITMLHGKGEHPIVSPVA